MSFNFHRVHGTQLVTDAGSGVALGWITMGNNGVNTDFQVKDMDGRDLGRYLTHAEAVSKLA